MVEYSSLVISFFLLFKSTGEETHTKLIIGSLQIKTFSTVFCYSALLGTVWCWLPFGHVSAKLTGLHFGALSQPKRFKSINTIFNKELHCGVKPWNPTDFEIESQWCICKQKPHKSTTIWELTFWALLFECQKRDSCFTPETVATSRGGWFHLLNKEHCLKHKSRAQTRGFHNFNRPWGPSPYKFDTWPQEVRLKFLYHGCHGCHIVISVMSTQLIWLWWS